MCQIIGQIIYPLFFNGWIIDFMGQNKTKISIYQEKKPDMTGKHHNIYQIMPFESHWMLLCVFFTWVWPDGNCFLHVRAATNGRVRQPRAPAPSIPRAELPNRASNPPASRIADLFTDRYVCGNEKNAWIGHVNNIANMVSLTDIPKNYSVKVFYAIIANFP